MARHGENIRKRKDGRWEGRYIKGKQPDGKTLWGYVYGGSYTAVKQTLLQKKAESCYYQLNGRDPSFRMLAERWFASLGESVKLSTAAHYRYTLDRYLLPVLGRYRVKELNEELLEQGLLQVIRPVDGSHKQLGAVLSRECLTLTRRICKYGAHLRLMRPVEIILRLPPKQAAAAKPLDRREQQLLEAFALQAPTARKLGLLLCMQLGLRIGEVCGLQWRDIDLKARVLTVRRTVQRIPCGGGKTQVVIQTPKTPSSWREMPIPKRLAAALRAVRGSLNGAVWFLSGGAALLPQKHPALPEKGDGASRPPAYAAAYLRDALCAARLRYQDPQRADGPRRRQCHVTEIRPHQPRAQTPRAGTHLPPRAASGQ